MIKKLVTEHNGAIFKNYNTIEPYDAVMTHNMSEKYVLNGLVSFSFMSGSYKYPDQFQVKVFSNREPQIAKRNPSGYYTTEICVDKAVIEEVFNAAYQDRLIKLKGGLKMDVQQELNRMREYKGSNFLKLEEGKHVIVFIGEPSDDTYNAPDGKVTQQAVFDVELGSEPFVWSVPKSKGTKGIFYQLCECAEKQGYKFNGLVVTVKVMGKDREKQYFVISAKGNDGEELDI